MSKRAARRNQGEPICIHNVSVYEDCERCANECGSPESSKTTLVGDFAVTALPCPYCAELVPIFTQVFEAALDETQPD